VRCSGTSSGWCSRRRHEKGGRSAVEMDMKALLRLVAEGNDLTEAQAEAAMTLMMNGEATPARWRRS
jgi:anthranilate phosphoribosyltransferase (EC 2.4.2.18)